MKKLTLRLIILITAMSTSFSSHAQLKDVADMLRGGTDDAEILFQGYLQPLTTAFGTNLNAGWYNTAKAHKPLGFDITITFNTTLIPDLDKTFLLEGLTASLPEGNEAPTAAGEREAGPQLDYNIPYGNTEIPVASFNTPQGIGIGFVPMPMGQIGIGLIKGTDVTFRYMPTLSLLKNNLELGLWGLGIKHDIKQWIPGISKIPILNLSVFGGWTKFDARTSLSLEPADLGLTNFIDRTNGASFDDQEMLIGVKSFTANLLVSANLPFVCFYGGVGFATTKTNLDLNGYYPLPGAITDPSDPDVGQVQVSAIENPLSMEIENTSGSVTSPRLNIGMRIKLGVITFHGDYTYSSYSVVTGGIGISFR